MCSFSRKCLQVIAELKNSSVQQDSSRSAPMEQLCDDVRANSPGEGKQYEIICKKQLLCLQRHSACIIFMYQEGRKTQPKPRQGLRHSLLVNFHRPNHTPDGIFPLSPRLHKKLLPVLGMAWVLPTLSFLCVDSLARAEAEAAAAAARILLEEQDSSKVITTPRDRLNRLRQHCREAGVSSSVEESLEQLSYKLPDILDLDAQAVHFLAQVGENDAMHVVCQLADIDTFSMRNISAYFMGMLKNTAGRQNGSSGLTGNDAETDVQFLMCHWLADDYLQCHIMLKHCVRSTSPCMISTTCLLLVIYPCIIAIASGVGLTAFACQRVQHLHCLLYHGGEPSALQAIKGKV